MLLTHEMEKATHAPVVVPRWLYSIRAKNRTTGAMERANFWTGEDEAQFTINGEVRTYAGAGSVITMSSPTHEIGGKINMQSVTLTRLAPEVEAAISNYDLRLAPVEIHLALFDPETGALIGVSRSLAGKVDEPQVKDGPSGEGSSLTLKLAPSARAGTKTLAAKKSPASQALRMATDKGREYADISGAVEVSWGGEDSNGYFVTR